MEITEQEKLKIKSEIEKKLSPRYTYEQFLLLLQEEESNTCPKCNAIFFNTIARRLRYCIWKEGIAERKLMEKIDKDKFCTKCLR